MIDEQSVIFTMAYAKNAGIWPRKKPDESGETKPGGSAGTYVGGGGIGSVSEQGGSDPPGAATQSFIAEGILKEALIRLWEQARAKKVESIEVLTIRMFEAGDAFRLFGAVGAVSGADKIVTITGRI